MNKNTDRIHKASNSGQINRFERGHTAQCDVFENGNHLAEISNVCLSSNKNDVEMQDISILMGSELLYEQQEKRLRKKSENKNQVKAVEKLKKIERDKLKAEKKSELQKQKVMKAIAVENHRKLKPEENIKFFEVHIDNNVINSVYGANIISLLQQNNIQYIVETQAKSNVITWSKRSVYKEMDEIGNPVEKIKYKEEKELIYIVEGEKIIELVSGNEILSHIEEIKSVYEGKCLTLVIYGLEKYFENQIQNYKKDRKKHSKDSMNSQTFNNSSAFIKEELEYATIQLQLLGRHNSRLIETPEELSRFVFNITKSLSQLDFKLDKQRRELDELNWFAKGDCNQAVKIEKDGTGLLKLWQQQICQFGSIGLETAQAILSQYNSPVSLVSKYLQCSNEHEAELMLQNIQIRRGAGLLSSTRRVGPQLSKKFYKFFSSDNPDEELQ